MYVRLTFHNKTEDYIFAEEPPYELLGLTLGELFRDFQNEYGRCVGKVFIDRRHPRKFWKFVPVPVGWVFEKRQEYSDCNETYLQHTWVTLLEDYRKGTVLEQRHLDISNASW